MLCNNRPRPLGTSSTASTAAPSRGAAERSRAPLRERPPHAPAEPTTGAGAGPPLLLAAWPRRRPATRPPTVAHELLLEEPDDTSPSSWSSPLSPALHRAVSCKEDRVVSGRQTPQQSGPNMRVRLCYYKRAVARAAGRCSQNAWSGTTLRERCAAAPFPPRKREPPRRVDAPRPAQPPAPQCRPPPQRAAGYRPPHAAPSSSTSRERRCTAGGGGQSCCCRCVVVACCEAGLVVVFQGCEQRLCA